MKNNKISAIIKNDIERSIKNKWFVILNLAMLLFVAVGLNLNNIKTILKNNNVSLENEISILVEDNTKIAYQIIADSMQKYENVTVEEKDNLEEFENENLSEDIVLLKIYNDDKEYIKATILSKEGINATYIDDIESVLNSIKSTIIATNKNLTEEEIKQIKTPVNIERVMLGQNVRDDSIETSILQIFSTYIIFFILLLCLNKIANTISQEKMSKSIEYVLTSITTKQYIIAKVLSMCFIVLIQFIFMIAYLIIGIMLMSIFSLSSESISISTNVSIGSMISMKAISYVVMTIIFMCLTTFIQGVIQTVMSAKTTNIQEAGNATILLVMINLVLYTIVTTMVSPLKPASILTYIISVLPIASMYFVPTMFMIGQANIFQIIIAFILLIASVPLSIILAEKPFKNAILDFTPKKEKKIKGIEKILSTTEYQERIIERKNSSKKGLIIGFAVILLLVLQIVGSLISSAVISTISEKITWLSQDNIYLIATCILFVISIYLPYLLLKSYLPKNEKKEISKEERKASIIKCIKYIVLSIPIMSIIQMICSFAIEKAGVGVNITDTLGIFNYNGKLANILLFIQIAILPAIFEELFIRKGVIGILKDKGAIFATVISSLIFATIHMNISQFIFAFLVGILFAIVRLKTDRMYPTMILHFLNNGFAVIEAILYNNIIFMQIFTYFIIAINAIGFCILIYMLYLKVMELKDKEHIQMLKEKLDYRKIKLNLVENMYVFKDFTFLLTVILSATLFVALDRILSLM